VKTFELTPNKAALVAAVGLIANTVLAIPVDITGYKKPSEKGRRG